MTIKERADEMIKLKECLKKIRKGDGVVFVRELEGIQVFSGIKRLAEALGQELQIRERKSRDYSKELAFEYKGNTFFELQDDDPDV